jgi:hypothetical protein
MTDEAKIQLQLFLNRSKKSRGCFMPFFTPFAPFLLVEDFLVSGAQKLAAYGTLIVPSFVQFLNDVV